jgi:hypothetical protein
MPAKERAVVVRKFKLENAAVKAEFDVGRVADTLHDELKRLITKKGYRLTLDGSDSITIDGSFVIIDEGNRFLRYLLAGMFGAAKVEVEGTIKDNGTSTPFSFSAKGYAGLFGGSGERLLVSGTKTLAKKVFQAFKSM